MEELLLEAQPREKLGSGLATLRKDGFLPSVIYGHGIENLPLAVPLKDFEKIYQKAGQNALIKLKIKGDKEGKQSRNVLIYDTAKDPRTGKFLHADFYQIAMDEKITVKVPLVFVGKSQAVADGGILVKNIHEVEIESLPKDLPSELQVDISSLEKFEDSIHVKNLTVPAGVKILTEPEEVAVAVVSPRSEEELKALEGEVVEKVEEVEVAAKEKKEEKGEGIKEETEKTEKEA